MTEPTGRGIRASLQSLTRVGIKARTGGRIVGYNINDPPLARVGMREKLKGGDVAYAKLLLA